MSFGPLGMVWPASCWLLSHGDDLFRKISLIKKRPEPRRKAARLCIHGDVSRVLGCELLERNPGTIFPTLLIFSCFVQRLIVERKGNC